MDEEKLTGVTLAFDCASLIGSVAVLRDGVVMSQPTEDARNPSRAEDLLLCVQSVLEGAGVRIDDVSRIAVATGPGSYSGIRIGLATAAGLARALGIEWFGVSLLQALTIKATSGNVLTAIPIGKADIAWQEFSARDSVRENGPARQNTESFFAEELVRLNAAQLVVSSSLIDRLPTVASHPGVIVASKNLAEHVAAFADINPDQTTHTPIYLRNETYAGAGF